MFTVRFVLFSSENISRNVICASEHDARCVYDALIASETCMFVSVHDADYAVMYGSED